MIEVDRTTGCESNSSRVPSNRICDALPVAPDLLLCQLLLRDRLLSIFLPSRSAAQALHCISPSGTETNESNRQGQRLESDLAESRHGEHVNAVNTRMWKHF